MRLPTDYRYTSFNLFGHAGQDVERYRGVAMALFRQMRMTNYSGLRSMAVFRVLDDGTVVRVQDDGGFVNVYVTPRPSFISAPEAVNEAATVDAEVIESIVMASAVTGVAATYYALYTLNPSAFNLFPSPSSYVQAEYRHGTPGSPILEDYYYPASALDGDGIIETVSTNHSLYMTGSELRVGITTPDTGFHASWGFDIAPQTFAYGTTIAASPTSGSPLIYDGQIIFGETAPNFAATAYYHGWKSVLSLLTNTTPVTTTQWVNNAGVWTMVPSPPSPIYTGSGFLWDDDASRATLITQVELPLHDTSAWEKSITIRKVFARTAAEVTTALTGYHST